MRPIHALGRPDEVIPWLGSNPTLILIAGVTLAALGAVVLTAVVVAIVRLIQRSVVARVPLTGENPIELLRPGSYRIHLEAPKFSRIPGGPILQFFGVQRGGPKLTLRDEATQEEVPLGTPLLPTGSSGFSVARREIRAFDAPRAGRYVLSCAGIDHERDWSRAAFLVTQPYSLKLLALILVGIVGLITFMGGAALSGWWAMIRVGI